MESHVLCENVFIFVIVFEKIKERGMMSEDKIMAKDLEHLFRENYSRYYYFALNFIEDAEIVKDIIGEVFLSVWRNHENIQKSKLCSYIFMSIRNKCLTQLKSKQPLAFVEDVASFLGGHVADSEEEWKQKEERILEMEKVVNGMPPRTRYVLEQFYYQHRSYKDIAEELGISTEGIKKQLVKGLSILRDHFNINKSKNRYHFVSFLVLLI